MRKVIQKGNSYFIILMLLITMLSEINIVSIQQNNTGNIFDGNDILSELVFANDLANTVFANEISENIRLNDVLFQEDFNDDVFQGSDWGRSDSSVSVNLEDGYLHMASDGNIDDFCTLNIAFDRPLTIEWRARLTGGGLEYTLPWLACNMNVTNDEYDISIAACDYGWMFGNWGWTNFELKCPLSEGLWRTMRVSFNEAGASLWAKEDSDISFTYITALPITWTNSTIVFTFQQPWDSVCDIDYIKVQDGLIDCSLTEEDFSTDVFELGTWSRTDSSVSVSSGNLHFSTGGGYSDYANFTTELPLPLTVQWKGRLVSGGRDYVLPQFRAWSTSNNDVKIDLHCVYDHWELQTGEFYTTPRPTSENTWFDVMLTIREDGGDLWARDDIEGWDDIGSTSWSMGSNSVIISFYQEWDAICDIDFVNIWCCSELNTTNIWADSDGNNIPDYIDVGNIEATPSFKMVDLWGIPGFPLRVYSLIPTTTYGAMMATLSGWGVTFSQEYDAIIPIILDFGNVLSVFSFMNMLAPSLVPEEMLNTLETLTCNDGHIRLLLIWGQSYVEGYDFASIVRDILKSVMISPESIISLILDIVPIFNMELYYLTEFGNAVVALKIFNLYETVTRELYQLSTSVIGTCLSVVLVLSAGEITGPLLAIMLSVKVFSLLLDVLVAFFHIDNPELNYIRVNLQALDPPEAKVVLQIKNCTNGDLIVGYNSNTGTDNTTSSKAFYFADNDSASLILLRDGGPYNLTTICVRVDESSTEKVKLPYTLWISDMISNETVATGGYLGVDESVSTIIDTDVDSLLIKHLSIESAYSYKRVEAGTALRIEVDVTYENGTVSDNADVVVETIYGMEYALNEGYGKYSYVLNTSLALGTLPIRFYTISNPVGYLGGQLNMLIIIEDTTAPILSGPEDFEYKVGSTGNYIEWNVTDCFPDRYSIYQNDSLLIENALASRQIILNVDGLDVGKYIYEIYVNDTSGNSALDTLIVTVIEAGTSNEVSFIFIILGIGVIGAIVIFFVSKKRLKQ